MNNADRENGTTADPLIFTVPAYGFVMALYLDWLGRPNRAAFLPKPLRKEVEPVESARPETPEQTD